MDTSKTFWPADPVERAAAAAAAGLHRPVAAGLPVALAELVAADPDRRVRAAALGALARLPDPPAEAWRTATADTDPSVRRRAADLAPAFAGADLSPLIALLADPEGGVAEAAAWALGELGDPAVAAGAVEPLVQAAGSHGDPLVREAAVAALGSLGDPAGREAVLAACRDKPAIRRRAVLALAAFEGPEVDAALQAALDDKDWQTRQAAEDLLG
ncbi:MAG: HEAT repeat domain-containing protein [Actinomycetota bacterium]